MRTATQAVLGRRLRWGDGALLCVPGRGQALCTGQLETGPRAPHPRGDAYPLDSSELGARQGSGQP